MLKRRISRNKDALPTIQKSNIDGSGLSVQMEAPILRAAKNASPYTRNSYIWCFSSLFLICWSWNHIWYHYATTFLECDADECVLKIIPPAKGKKLTLKFSREQIVKAITLKVDENGEKDMGNFDSYGIELSQYGKGAFVDAFDLQREELRQKVEESLSEKELEEMQNYGSAIFTDPDLREKLKSQEKSNDSDAGPNADSIISENRNRKKERILDYGLPNIEALKNYAINEGDGQYLLVMRKYNIHHRKRRVSAFTNKIDLYASGTKNRLLIRENRNVVWQAILGIIFGVFSLLFSALLGQFSEPEKKKKTRGPGSRKTMSSYSSQKVSSIPNRQAKHRQSRPKAYGGYNPNGNISNSY